MALLTISYVLDTCLIAARKWVASAIISKQNHKTIHKRIVNEERVHYIITCYPIQKRYSNCESQTESMKVATCCTADKQWSEPNSRLRKGTIYLTIFLLTFLSDRSNYCTTLWHMEWADQIKPTATTSKLRRGLRRPPSWIFSIGSLYCYQLLFT